MVCDARRPFQLTQTEIALPTREAFLDALLDTDRFAARRVLESACQAAGPGGALDALMMPALDRVGALWESGEVALAQVPVRDYGIGLGAGDLVGALGAAGLAVKVAVGGAPFVFDRRLLGGEQ
jgi:hypothetical protein